VLNRPIYKAIGRELDALNMLNKAVEQEPLKSALAKACEDAKKEEGGEAMQASLGAALEAAREEAAARNKTADEEKEEKGDDGDGGAAAVPQSPFSLAIAAQIEAEEAKGDDMGYALLGRLTSEDLPAALAADIAAHEAQVACAARKAELDAQMAAAKAAKDYTLCGELQVGVKEAAAQLEAATDARAKEWALPEAVAERKQKAKHAGKWVRRRHQEGGGVRCVGTYACIRYGGGCLSCLVWAYPPR
jgi:hypothetical protein